MNQIFIDAINQKRLVQITFDSKEKGVISRLCVPFDIGPSRRAKDTSDRYHCYDLNSPDGQHTLSILPQQLISITPTDKQFEPETYITWTPNWFLDRDWGNYS